MVLEVECAFFDEHRGDWLREHEGKFALVQGEELAGFYDSEENAYAAGVSRWGNTPLLIKQVLAEDRVEQAPALVFGLL